MSDQPEKRPNPGPEVLRDAGPLTMAEAELKHELQAVRRYWWVFLAMGVGLVVLGMVAIGTMFWVSVLTVAVFGVLLLIGGVTQILSSFWAGRWKGFVLHVLIGILYIVTGFVLVDHPLEAAITLTLLIAAFLVVSGVFRMVVALSEQFHNWGWVLLNGAVATILGLLIYKQWPSSGLWVIGLFVGIEMIFNGWFWIMLSLGLRSIPAERAGEKAPPEQPPAA
jgi:uncharacterized membrane protein HdeD (DUF308 family)